MLSQENIDFFENILSPDHVIHGLNLDSMNHYALDRTKLFTAKPSAILFPKTTDEIQKIVRYCYEHELVIVPSGGRTGYAGGAVAKAGEIVISLDKMNQVLSLDENFGLVTVQAGIITDELNNHLKDFNLYFPMQFAATGSSHIGGNIATNSGGMRVVRYGALKSWVLGITIVDGTGEIRKFGGPYLKDSSSLELMSLLIGSEGILGVITEATLRLTKLPGDSLVFLMGLDSYEKIMALYRSARDLPMPLTAFEFFTRFCMEKVIEFLPDTKDPFPEPYPYYVLLELEGCRSMNCGKRNEVEFFLQSLLEQNIISDGLSAQNSRQSKSLWHYRESISEALTLYNSVHKNDISLPMASLKSFIQELEKGIAEKYGHIEMALFGHLGDGNLHVNFIKPDFCTEERFRGRVHEIDDFVYGLVAKYDGSISAEHGIGLLKGEALKKFISQWEWQAMKQIKQIFDPKGIMNPDKILKI